MLELEWGLFTLVEKIDEVDCSGIIDNACKFE